MSKSKEKIRVSFGYNSEQVTGSHTLITLPHSKKKILIDYGLSQGGTLLEEYRDNTKKPNFKPKDIDYIILTHLHIDHSGRIAQLYAQGCTAPLFVAEGASDIYKALALDSANICMKDAESLEKKFGREFPPVITDDDVYNSLNYLKELPVGEKIEIDEYITIKLTYNHHIFSSVSITLWLKNGSSTRKIIVTGDLGNTAVPQYYVEDFTPFESANLLIGECTYATEERNAGPKERRKDLEKIRTLPDVKGRVLIPAFAYGRSPMILTMLYEQLKDADIQVIYASPLGTKLLDIYKKKYPELDDVMKWDKLKILSSFTQLESELADQKGHKIFVCPSGMLNAGYSVYVATQLLPHSADLICFCGYSAEGTLAHKIRQKKTKTIAIDGKNIHSRCQVMNLVSLSSHMQHRELLALYSQKDGQTQYDKIALVHGNQNDKIEFAKELQEECSKHNRTTKVIATNKSTEITL